jgi:transcriptional repressor NrdR
MDRRDRNPIGTGYASAVRCPYCGASDDRVVDSRESREGAVIRRRRECSACERRFTSYETVEEIPVLVIKRDGRREPFDRNKLLRGLMKACEKRSVETRSLEQICEEMETALHAREPREMSTEELGTRVMERLKELDQVAYVRFASVYRRFEDLGDFVDELKTLLGRRPGTRKR